MVCQSILPHKTQRSTITHCQKQKTHTSKWFCSASNRHIWPHTHLHRCIGTNTPHLGYADKDTVGAWQDTRSMRGQCCDIWKEASPHKGKQMIFYQQTDRETKQLIKRTSKNTVTVKAFLTYFFSLNHVFQKRQTENINFPVLMRLKIQLNQPFSGN